MFLFIEIKLIKYTQVILLLALFGMQRKYLGLMILKLTADIGEGYKLQFIHLYLMCKSYDIAFR